MANSRDSHSASLSTGSSPLSWTHTISDNTNGLVVVLVISRDGDLITGATYNGVSMSGGSGSLKYDTTFSGASSTRFLYIFYLFNPPTGSKTVSVSWSGSPGRVEGYAVAYAGAKQSGFPDAVASVHNNGSAHPTSTTLTTVLANCWSILIAYVGGGSGVSGTNATIIDDQTGSGSSVDADSNGDLPAGSNTISLSESSNGEMAMLIVSFAPVAPVANGNFLSLL